MATPTEKLAASLDVLRELEKDGRRILRSESISRVHRERLLRHGIVLPLMKGWLVRATRDDRALDAGAFWDFCALYCTDRFGAEWHLSPEQSLLLHTGSRAVPRRVVVHAARGTNNTVELPFGTSIYDLRNHPLPPAGDVVACDGLRLLAPAAALIRIPESFFRQHADTARRALAGIADTAAFVARLRDGGHSVVSGRLAGALRHIGRTDTAAEILTAMKAAGYDVREVDPFASEPAAAAAHAVHEASAVHEARAGHAASAPREPRAASSSIVARMQGLWAAMREPVVTTFPAAPQARWPAERYLAVLDDLYRADAYHSLALEGHRVSSELIDRTRSGAAVADAAGGAGASEVAAARGYWRAFQSVRATVARILAGENAGALVRGAFPDWERELREPFAAPDDGSSDRGGADARGVRAPASRGNSVRDALPAVFDLMEAEPEACVRAVLGHWMFGYLHLYPERDGRLARFVMNVMLASGGYPWTIIRAEHGASYAAALDSASGAADILPLARFVAERVGWSIEFQQRRYG